MTMSMLSTMVDSTRAATLAEMVTHGFYRSGLSEESS